jgi:hypothetical protein
MATIKLKLLPPSTMKAKGATNIVGQVLAGDGILVTKAAGSFTVAVDNGGVAPQPFDNDLQAISDMTSTEIGVVHRTAEGVWDAVAGSTSGYALMAAGAGVLPSYQGFLQAGTGAVTRTWQDKARDTVYAADWGVVADGVTDNYTAMFSLMTAMSATGNCVVMPVGIVLINMSGTRASIPVDNCRIRGTHNGFDVDVAAASKGSWIHITGISNSPFALGNNAAVFDLVFKYPAQTNLASPITYPATILVNGSTVRIEGNISINATTFIYLQTGGFYEIHRNRISAFSKAINIGLTAAECHITGNDISNAWAQAFYFTIYGEYTTVNTAIALAYGIHFTGAQNDAVHIIDNGFLGYDIGIIGDFNGTETSVSGLWGIIVGNTFDHCRLGLDLANKYRPRNVIFAHNEIDGTNIGTSYGVLMLLTGANTGILNLSANTFGGTGGKHVRIEASNAAQNVRLNVVGGSMIGMGQGVGSGQGLYVNGSGIQVVMTGVTLDGDGNTTPTGVEIAAGRSVNITGCTLKALDTGILISGTIAKDVVIGNIVADTVTTLYTRTGTITGSEAVNLPQGTLVSTDPGATVGPTFTLYRNSASPAVSDIIGAVSYTGKNSAAAVKEYARTHTVITDPASTTEDSNYIIQTQVAGALADRVLVGAGMYFPGATSGDQGAGTVNAQAVLKNGVNLVTAADVKTLTNTTYNTAGTGNAFTVNSVSLDTAWATYTPTVTANSGSFTAYTATGRYKDIGKTRHISVDINVTTVGTAAVSANVTLPSGTTAAHAQSLSATNFTDATPGVGYTTSGASVIVFAPPGLAFANKFYIIGGTIEMA